MGDSDKTRSFVVRSPEEVKEDETNKVYALCVCKGVRFRVKSCSSVRIAVISIEEPKRIHSGLILKNESKFFVTHGGKETEYSYVVAHALYHSEDEALRPTLMIEFCDSESEAVNILQKVYAVGNFFTPALSKEFVSKMPCFELVKAIKSELNKPFDKLWKERLQKKAEEALDSVTNSALFATRMYNALAQDDDNKEEKVIEPIKEVFKAADISEDMIDTYIDDLRK